MLMGAILETEENMKKCVMYVMYRDAFWKGLILSSE